MTAAPFTFGRRRRRNAGTLAAELVRGRRDDRKLWRAEFRSTAVPTQEAGRQVIHHAYYQWRATQGGHADFWQARKGLDEWLTKFYAAARDELGLDGASVYEDPAEKLPVPGVTAKKAADPQTRESPPEP